MVKAIFFDVDGTLVSFHTHTISASTLEALHALREKGILVRRWDAPRIDQWLRISIGTDKEMDTLCQTLKGILAGN